MPVTLEAALDEYRYLRDSAYNFVGMRDEGSQAPYDDIHDALWHLRMTVVRTADREEEA